MRHVADRFTAILDANVLYPFLGRDVLLSLAEAGLYRPLWSPQIMAEWSSHLIAKKPESEAKIKNTVKLMEKAFPEAMIESYEALIPNLNLPDPNDRHVLAAAIKGGANVIVTNNLKHFPENDLEAFDIEARSMDDFAVNTFQLYEADALIALKAMRTQYGNPPLTQEELVNRLIANGMVLFGAELTPHIHAF